MQLSLQLLIQLHFAACFFINAAILILAAASFHSSGYGDVADIMDAYKLLDPVLGVTLASFLFAIALLASGRTDLDRNTCGSKLLWKDLLTSG
jgi:manganese transport protein